MNNRNLGQGIERWARLIPDAIWLTLGAASGFIAGRIMGRTVFRIAVFQHTAAASMVAVCLIAVFVAARKKLPQVSGWCLWFGAFSIGLLTLR